VFASGFYHDPAAISATDRGSDLVTLFVFAPALAVALLYAYRGSLRAQVIWLGLVSWVLYAIRRVRDREAPGSNPGPPTKNRIQIVN
jgi:hypothetical protein